MRRPILIAASITTALLVGAVAGGAAGAPANAPTADEARAVAAKAAPRRVTVNIDDFRYRPRTVTVRRGGKVTWFNREFPNHTARFRGPNGDTGNISENKRRSLTLRKVGRFSYVCAYHPSMRGTVIVRAR